MILVHLLADYISLYISTIPYILFFLVLFDHKRPTRQIFIDLLWIHVLLLVSYELSLLFPTEVIGMLVKTAFSWFVLTVYCARVFHQPYGTALFYLIVGSIACVAGELLCSIFFDFSYYTSYLSETISILEDIAATVLMTLAGSVITVLIGRWLRLHQMQVSIPLPYQIPALLTIVLLAMQGAALFYFHTSLTISPAYYVLVLTALSVPVVLNPILLLYNESHLQESVSRLPLLLSAQKHLTAHQGDLDRQIRQIASYEEEILRYRREGDLSKSINPLFLEQSAYTESLYTDNPVINTLLTHYAKQFEEAHIPYEFSFAASTYSPFSDFILVYLLSGLLNQGAETVSVAFRRHANLYELKFQTSRRSWDAVLLHLTAFEQAVSGIEVSHTLKPDGDQLAADVILVS